MAEDDAGRPQADAAQPLVAARDLVKRFGHSGYLDFGDIVVDFVSLGLVDRPWYHARYGAAGPTLGYYDSEQFVADEWKPGYRNDAYDELTEPDAAWMARIVSRFRDEHIHAMVERGQFSDEIVDNLAAEARSTSDRERRAELYRELQLRVAEVGPMAFIYNYHFVDALRADVKGYTFNPQLVDYRSVREVWLDR